MEPAFLLELMLVLVSLAMFSYVGFQVHRKRKAMQFITIRERKLFQNLLIVATTIIFCAIIGAGTVLV